jgi:hypothetical protein
MCTFYIHCGLPCPHIANTFDVLGYTCPPFTAHIVLFFFFFASWHLWNFWQLSYYFIPAGSTWQKFGFGCILHTFPWQLLWNTLAHLSLHLLHWFFGLL